VLKRISSGKTNIANSGTEAVLLGNGIGFKIRHGGFLWIGGKVNLMGDGEKGRKKDTQFWQQPTGLR